MHQDLLQFQACQNPFRWPKTQIPRPWYFETIFDRCLGACWPKLIISRKYFWVIVLFLDRNDINNFGPKDHLSKTILILRSNASIWKAVYGTCRCPEQMKKKWKKNKRKNDCYVMHLKNSIKPKWESRRSKNAKKNDEKSHKHKSFPSCKESLFNLGNYVWDEKWPSFIILSLI